MIENITMYSIVEWIFELSICVVLIRYCLIPSIKDLIKAIKE